MEKTYDIVVVGGGLNGSTLALGAAKLGLRVLVIDALPDHVQVAADFDGRSYALALTSVRLLNAIGIWESIAAAAQPMLDIKVFDGAVGATPSSFFMHFDHTEIEDGPMGHMVEDRHLRPVMQRAIRAEDNITYLSNTKVVDQTLTDTGITVTCDTGDHFHAQLVIGADGRGSPTALRAGIGRTGWKYGQTALVCAIEHEHPHNGVAYQYFMPAGPLAILPLSGNRSSIVWSETHENAKIIMALDDEDYLEILRPRFGSFLGQIALAGQRFSYPLDLTMAKAFVAPRVALIGDAAHGVHPIAGQGLNAGLRDIAALCDVIQSAKERGEDFASVAVLNRYQEWRRFDNHSLAFATDSFNKLFSNDNPILRIGRDIGMGIVNAFPQVRRSFIREAAGLTGDLPRWMR
ncbi:MAG: 2-octaprenyl-6-methoxyphenyl hydroxylase [Rhodobacteraceae bacterium]|nr:2-octaprenyl-6-methoxyphenyl hydroxylase [Paracoccaceae bacterium]